MTPAKDRPAGLSVTQYAEAKKLPVSFLQGLGLREIRRSGRLAVTIPYEDQRGREVRVRVRLALEGPDRFRWGKGSQVIPYGLATLDGARKAGQIVLVEGESDAQTLWFHRIPALGVPGATSWKPEWAAYLEEIETIYVVLEPDRGGEAVAQWIGKAPFRDRVKVVGLGQAKDVSGFYLADPRSFPQRWRAAVAAAVPFAERVRLMAQRERDAAWAVCRTLAQERRILDRLQEALQAAGVVGEARVGPLLYVGLGTRFLPRPVSMAIKAPSAAGKSYITDRVLEFFPPRAYYGLTAMSEKALAYSEEPLSNRFLVLYEAAGLSGSFVNYFIRSLLSEGRLRYETVEKTREGLRARIIERTGPTGLIVTTTAVNLHPENETRLLSIPVKDTRRQTAEVLRQLARRGRGPRVDLTPWLALQTWLEGGEHRVVIPFAERLARLIPPVALRLRRDFGTLLSLIEGHAILHQATRPRGASGAIIAVLDDYAVVHGLVADLVAEGVEAVVPGIVRETVQAVKRLDERGPLGEGVTVKAIARALQLDSASVLRRTRMAQTLGYLQNLETGKWRPARLVLGEPMPSEQVILPLPTDPDFAEGAAADIAQVRVQAIFVASSRSYLARGVL
jgi:hypothetical protein